MWSVAADVERPSIICPPDVRTTLGSGQSSKAVRLGNATVADNCGAARLTNNASTSYRLGITVVMWTATDAGGLRARCKQKVTVRASEYSVDRGPS